MRDEANIELISVIVPVYNVKEYLDRCVESLRRQKYTKLEIILVDDGSTDGSGEKCDYYSKLDSRIKVIHKINGGLSDARNVGIESCRGELVAFVDSDDWVSNEYISLMYDNLKEFQADISGCSFRYVTDYTQISIGENEKVRVWNSEEALRALLQQDEYTTSAWGLLIKRYLFDDICFPVGMFYEDLGTVYKLLHKATKIVNTSAVLYFYYIREGSIQNKKFVEKHLDELVLAKELYLFIKCNYPKIEFAARERLVGVCFHLILMMERHYCSKSSYSCEIMNIIKNNRYAVLKDKRTTAKVKYACLLSYLGIDAVRLVYRLLNIKGRIDI